MAQRLVSEFLLPCVAEIAPRNFVHTQGSSLARGDLIRLQLPPCCHPGGRNEIPRDPLRVAAHRVERQEQHRPELSVRVGKEIAVKRPVGGNLQGLQDVAVGDGPHAARGAAAQDDNVPHGALGGLDGAFSLLVAALGDRPDDDERAGRALGAGRLEEAARFPEGIAASFFSAAPCSERGL